MCKGDKVHESPTAYFLSEDLSLLSVLSIYVCEPATNARVSPNLFSLRSTVNVATEVLVKLRILLHNKT